MGTYVGEVLDSEHFASDELASKQQLRTAIGVEL